METKDLIIRESVWEELEIFYKWELMPEVNKYFSIPDNQSFKAVTCTYIHDEENSSQRQYTITLKDTGEPIGRIVLADLIENWKVEIFRIYIGELSYRNRGFGRQAMEAILRLCFDEWKLKRVYLDHYTGNPAAHLYKSLGFNYEGVLRQNCRKNGVLYDVHLMSMLESEYIEKYHNI